MLSFDITDRNIRVVRGVDSGSKVRVISGATLNLEEEVIVNGYVRDVPRLATLINDVLTANRMVDKDVMVCISSNITIFKELKVHKASKEAEFQKMVKAEMYSAMNIDDSYGIAYVVANAAADDDGMV
ncbi:MAG: pilus assembly protein PilM, partial [Oscillospiraceae bacterium]|nr:pilus assembly protein PilM [Oscillospiraceae bacterium]